MNGAEVLRDVQTLVRIKEAEGAPAGTINPEVLAMKEFLPVLSPRYVDFVKRRMAFDVVHLSEPRVSVDEFEAWRAIKSEIKDYLPEVPQDISSLPSGWRRVFHDVMILYGDPNRE